MDTHATRNFQRVLWKHPADAYVARCFLYPRGPVDCEESHAQGMQHHTRRWHSRLVNDAMSIATRPRKNRLEPMTPKHFPMQDMAATLG
jgi:hypothetical protein